MRLSSISRGPSALHTPLASRLTAGAHLALFVSTIATSQQTAQQKRFQNHVRVSHISVDSNPARAHVWGLYERLIQISYRSLKIHAGRRSDGMRTIAFTVVVCSVHFTGSGQMIIKQIQCVSGAQKQSVYL